MFIFVMSSLLFIPEQEVEEKMITILKNELKRLSSGHPACPANEVEDDHIVREMVVKFTTHVLKQMNQEDLVKSLQKGKKVV